MKNKWLDVHVLVRINRHECEYGFCCSCYYYSNKIYIERNDLCRHLSTEKIDWFLADSSAVVVVLKKIEILKYFSRLDV